MATHVDIHIGQLPYIFNGFDNGGSTGYAWSVQIENPTVVQFTRTSPSVGQDTRQLCGGGIDFAYEFHPTSVGDTDINIYHGRPWEQRPVTQTRINADGTSTTITSGPTPEATIHLHVKDSLGDLDALVERELLHLQELQGALGQELRSHKESNSTSSLGMDLFLIRTQTRELAMQLERNQEAVQKESDHEALLASLNVEYDGINRAVETLETRQLELVARLEVLSGMKCASKTKFEESSLLNHAPGTSEKDRNQKDAIHRMRERIQHGKISQVDLQQEIGQLEQDIVAFEKKT